MPGPSLLSFAIQYGSVEGLELLLQREHIRWQSGWKTDDSLYQAARQQGEASLQMVTLLLRHGAYINAKGGSERDEHALEAAAKYGRVEAVQMLLPDGMIADGVLEAAMFHAVGEKSLELVRILIRHGVDANGAATHGFYLHRRSFLSRPL